MNKEDNSSEKNVANYTDWHLDIAEPANESILFYGSKSINVPNALHDFAIRFAKETKEVANNRSSFIVNVDKYKFRMQLMRTNRYAARLIRSEIPTFESLGFKDPYKEYFASEELRRRGGLIIFSGQTGSGKTSSMAAVITERLKKLGGFCLTIEDPIEYNLFGRHGENGWVEQLDSSDIGYGNSIMKSLRCFPSSDQSMLMLGEIRNEESAMELLRIALDGHLVLTTMHASDIPSAIQRLISLASKGNIEKEAKKLLCESLRCVAHQRLLSGVLQMTILEINEEVGSIIENGNLSSLKDQVDRNKHRLMAKYNNG